MSWIDLQRNWLPEIESSMAQLIRSFSPENSTLVSMSDYHLSTGGKRLRALLPLAVADVLDVDKEKMIPFSCACELLHNATLVHDDLQDGDTMRRDSQTVWVKYGIPQAINVGDALLYYAIGALQTIDAQPSLLVELSTRFVKDTLYVIDGQEREFLLIQEEPSLENYFRMVEGKTSGLFALPFGGAAMLCGTTESTLKAIDDASRHLGVIFQIQDDLLDIFAEKGRERKGSDIAEGKRSALATFALLNTKGKEKELLTQVLNKDRENVTDDDIAHVSTIFKTGGALEFSLKEIDSRVDKVRALLENYPHFLRVADALIESFLEPIKRVGELI